MGAKAPIFSEFGAKARIPFCLAPPKKEVLRLSTISNAMIRATAPDFAEFCAEAQLPRKIKKATQVCKQSCIFTSFCIDFRSNLGQFWVHVASWVGSWG